MMTKFQRAMKVVKDLKTLDFVYDYCTLTHPNDNYSLWLSPFGYYWFMAFHRIGDEYVYNKHDISKFGAIGKTLVWWYALKQIKAGEKLRAKQRKQELEDYDKYFQ